MPSWLVGIGGKILGFLGLIAGALFVWKRGDYHKQRADNAERNTDAMMAQVEQRNDAVEAARVAGVEGAEEVQNAVDKAKSGDLSGLNG